MPEGTPRSAFGDPVDDLGPAVDVLTQGLEDVPSPQPDEVPEQAQITLPVAAETPQTPPEEAPEPQPEPQEAPEKLWAGKFRSPEDMEKGYREFGTRIREEAQARRAAEQRLNDLTQQVQAYVAQQQAPQPAQPQANDPSDAELASLGIDRDTYRQIAPVLNRLVEQRVSPIAEQLSAQQQQALANYQAQQVQFEAQREAEQGQRVLDEFYQRHQITVGDDTHTALADLVETWNRSWTGDPTGAAPGSFNTADADSLEILAEAASRPALAQVLRFNPNYIDDDEGMALARQQATLYEATQRTPTQATPAAAGLPQVETGPSGSGPRQLDVRPPNPIEEIMELDQKEKQRSAFFRG